MARRVCLVTQKTMIPTANRHVRLSRRRLGLDHDLDRKAIANPIKKEHIVLVNLGVIFRPNQTTLVVSSKAILLVSLRLAKISGIVTDPSILYGSCGRNECLPEPREIAVA